METVETQPEIVAHHYTEAGLAEHAIRYWQQAGTLASQHFGHAEAIAHLTRGVHLLELLPDSAGRAEQELLLQTTLGPALMTTKGWGASEVGHAYTRARELCQQIGGPSQLFPILWGLWQFHVTRAAYETALELGEQLLHLAQRLDDSALLIEAHFTFGLTLFWSGEFVSAREHVELGIALYDRQQHRSHLLEYGQDPGAGCLCYAAWSLWILGYPAQALKRSQEALSLAQELDHPFSLAIAQGGAVCVHQLRREAQVVREWTEVNMTLSTEQGFAFWVLWGSIMHGWALAELGQREEGIPQIQQGLATYRAIGAEIILPYNYALLAESYGKVGQIEDGMSMLAQAFSLVEKNGERMWEAELHRLKGELVLNDERRMMNDERKTEQANFQGHAAEAEASFQQAIEIARRQQAKSLELRAATSLARLWQQQGKKDEAHTLLSEIFNWFTEGFDTPDLKDAKVLLDVLSEDV